MRMIRAAMPVALALMLAAGPAEARRFRFFGGGGGGGEMITLVKDLPDREPFLRDGDAWDVGYLDSMVKPDGYVLYHGDAYIRLDGEALELLKAELGSDPTAAHRTAAAAARKASTTTTENAVERQPGETREAFAARARRELADRNAGASSAKSSTGGGGAARMLLALLIGGIGIFAVFKLAKAAFKPTERNEVTDDEPGTADTGSFDQRVSRRLAEMQGGGPIGPAASVAGPAGVRTFGRRSA